MCTCASCSYTHSLKEWPSGAPMGKRASDAAYAAHVRHGQAWGRSPNGNMHHAPEIPAGVWTRPPFPCTGTPWSDPGKVRSYPTAADAKRGTAHYVAQFLAANGYAVEKERAAEAAPPRPAQPGKAAQHLPELNRQPEPTAIIYAMPKAKPKQEPKRPRGRPSIDGRRVVIKLEERQIKAAEKLGGGNVAAGIRAALARTG